MNRFSKMELPIIKDKNNNHSFPPAVKRDNKQLCTLIYSVVAKYECLDEVTHTALVFIMVFLKQMLLMVFLHVQCSFGKPLSDKDAQLTWYESSNDGNGNFSYSTTNGITLFHSAHATAEKTGETRTSAEGTYSYVTPEKVLTEVRYTTDEKSYHPQVSVRTQSDANNTTIQDVPPPVSSPPAIQRTDNCTVTLDESAEASNTTLATAEDCGVDSNYTKNVAELELPNRIGQAAIISLQGPPG